MIHQSFEVWCVVLHVNHGYNSGRSVHGLLAAHCMGGVLVHWYTTTVDAMMIFSMRIRDDAVSQFSSCTGTIYCMSYPA